MNLRILALASVHTALLGLSACTRHPDLYARYEPNGPDDVWVQGARLHTGSTPAGTRPDLRFTSGFVGKTLDYVSYDTTSTSPLRFSVRVFNAGDSTVLLEPTRFRLWDAESSWAFRCLDPEKVIQAAENNMRREQDDYVASQGIEALITLPLLVATTVAKKTPEEEKENRRYWKEKEEGDRREAEDHAKALAASDAVHRGWSELALRKTTLFPGREAHGLVAFIDDFPYHRPDSLELQYEVAPGRFLDLGRYGKIVDSAAILEKERKRKERRIRPETGTGI